MHRILLMALLAVFAVASALPSAAADLATKFADPPQDARARVWWLWLHSTTSKSRITYDLEEMKKKGIGGFLQWDPGPGPSRYGTRADELPPSPLWMSPEWRDALRHALAEADRLGLEGAIALMPGANCAGPWITPELSAQKVVWSVTNVTGPMRFSEVLELPDGVPRGPDGRPLYYKDIAVFAGEPYRVGQGRGGSEVAQLYPTVDLQNIEIGDPWTDVTSRMDARGRLTWDVPPGHVSHPADWPHRHRTASRLLSSGRYRPLRRPHESEGHRIQLPHHAQGVVRHGATARQPQVRPLRQLRNFQRELDARPAGRIPPPQGLRSHAVSADPRRRPREEPRHHRALSRRSGPHARRLLRRVPLPASVRSRAQPGLEVP